MTVIKDILARQIIDSRGNPTVEVDVSLDDNSIGRASAPSGASTGKYEAFELRDNDSKRFNGMGVQKAVANVNTEIKDLLIGAEPFDQKKTDKSLIELDGTENKCRLGANAILATSIAIAKACAISQKCNLFEYFGNTTSTFLPVPLMNIINGGKHADNNLDFQEFMIVPSGADSIIEAIRMGCEVFQSLKNELAKNNLNTAVGDEGGFAPNLKSNEEALDLIAEAIENSGYKIGKDIYFALDCAATEYFDGAKYIISEEKLNMSSDEKVNYLEKLVKSYPIISIEDGMAEDDWQGWQMLTEKLGRRCQLVGDDLFVTNLERLKVGIERKCANSILIKPNQIGTLTETFNSIDLAHQNQLSCIMSHRSGETEDNYISDLCVAKNCNQIKTGSLNRSERLSKYNQLIRIEEILGNKAKYSGPLAFNNFTL